MLPWSTDTGSLVESLGVVEEPGEVGSGRLEPAPRPAGVLQEGAAGPPGVVAVLPPWEEVDVAGLCHSPEGKSPAKLFPPGCQPAETKPGQGGVIVSPP